MSRPVWQILTGEYPPAPGGVADYTGQIAAGLAAAGETVHVWTSRGGVEGDERNADPRSGPVVHQVAGWSPTDLAVLDGALDGFDVPRRLLVQYTPNVWGYKGLNLGFCRWLAGRRKTRGDEVRLMFHEVAYPWLLRDRPTRWLLAAGHRAMARIVLSAGGPVDVSTPAWEPLLRRCGAGARRPIGWRPVPSNVPAIVDESRVEAIRRRVAPGGEHVIGSFSSFTGLSGEGLTRVLAEALHDRPDRVALLIGKGSVEFAARLRDDHADWSARAIATGPLTAAEISLHLQAADLTVQPYHDGLTTRRTSLMASLANGRPAVSNIGHLTEPFWADTAAVALASGVSTIAATLERLLADPAECARLGATGRALYERRFAVERTIEALLG